MLKENKSRIYWIDFLKGIGALFVILEHFWPYAIDLFNKTKNKFDLIMDEIVLGYIDIGKVGVALFFLISGYLTANVFRKKSRLEFVRDRIHRLYPVYWFSILIYCIAFGIPTLKILLSNITMFQQFVGIPNMVGAFWTLQIDIIFYIGIVGMATIGIYDNPKWTKALYYIFNVLAILMGIVRFVSDKKLPVAIGILISLTFLGIMIKRNEAKEEYNILLNVIMFIIMCSITSILAYSNRLTEIYVSFRYICTYIVALALFFICKKVVNKNNPICFVGKISYSTYLMHATVGFVIMDQLVKYNFFNMYSALIITLIFTLIVSAIVNKYIENIWSDLYKKKENNQPKILYINGRFLTQKITGVQRYAIEVVKQLDKMLTTEDKIVILYPKNITQNLELKNIELKQIGNLKGHLWEQISLPLYLFGKKNAKLLSMCNIAPILFPGYVVLHDISFKTHPEHLNKKFALWYRIITKLNIKSYRHIFTVSEFSKKEIVDNYKISEDKITVTYNSAEHILNVKADENIIKKLNLESKEFIFSLGSASPHKNRKFIIECAKNNPKNIFVITGNNNNIFNEEKYNDLNNVIFTGYLNDGEIVALYKNCKAFLFPSTYEGFGIPPLEALTLGCKNVIVSDIDVLNEIYCDNVNYINVFDSNYFLDDLLKKEISNTYNLVEKYKWEKCANILLKYIK